MLKNNRAQTILEYFILLGLAVAVLIGMRLFMTRSLQEKYRQTADVYGKGEQYEKGVTQVTSLDSAVNNAVIPVNPSLNPCPVVLDSVTNFQLSINNLDIRINFLNQSLAQLNSSLSLLLANNMANQSSSLTARVNDLNNEISQCQADNAAYQSQIAQLKTNYPQCF